MDVFREGKFQLFGLMETKLKENGEVSWCGANGIIAGIQEMERAREGVAILLNDVWHSAAVDFGYISYRSLWITFKFLRVKFVLLWGMAPMNVEEGTYSEMTRA